MCDAAKNGILGQQFMNSDDLKAKLRDKRKCTAVWATLLIIATAASVGVLGTIYSGLYDVAAVKQHTAPVYWVLDTGLRYAIRRSAQGVIAPRLDDAQLLRRGFLLYRDSCVQCHGAPGVAPAAFSHGLMPPPNNLAQTALEWRAEEVYWVTRNGLKMTGMPAWQFRYSDDDLWAIVAFVMQMPRLSSREFAEMNRARHELSEVLPNDAPTAGDPHRGEIALQQYACVTCHRIPGIVGAVAHVGPTLEGIAQRKYLAGRLPLSGASLVTWIRRPKSVKPETLMPDLGVSQAHAVDMAAYLLTLK